MRRPSPGADTFGMRPAVKLVAALAVLLAAFVAAGCALAGILDTFGDPGGTP